MNVWEKVKAFLKDEPIYAPSPEGRVDGWRTAYELQTDKLTVANKRLNMLRAYADAVIAHGSHTQCGRDILTVLTMTDEELDEDYEEER